MEISDFFRVYNLLTIFHYSLLPISEPNEQNIPRDLGGAWFSLCYCFYQLGVGNVFVEEHFTFPYIMANIILELNTLH